MSSQLFESLLILKYNAMFWNEQLVTNVVKSARSDRSDALINSHEVYEEVAE